MNPIRPQPYPQRNQGNYNAGNEGTDKDGHNSQGQDRHQQNQNQQTVARGRAEEVGKQSVRPAVYSPAANAYAQNYTTPNHPQISNYNIQARQINPQQYQAISGGYQTIPQQQERRSRWKEPGKNLLRRQSTTRQKTKAQFQ